MEELTIIEVTRDGFVAVSRDGQRFFIPLDGSIRAQLSVSPLSQSTAPVSPKEIQALLRSGLSVDDVAARTGSSAEHIARFESPIAAELAFVLERALSVPVVGNGTDSTFGAEINARIVEQGGAVTGWQAYRIDDVWVVGARCLVGSAEEDATWSFDPRKMTLVPSNAVAIRISRSDSADATLFPPLRVMPSKPLTRFDSGEFEPIPPAKTTPSQSTDTADEAAADGVRPVPQNSSIVIDVESVVASIQPAAPIDLVDEMERRRGDRRDAIASHPSTGSIPIITPDMLEVPDDSPVAPDDVPATQVSDSTDLPPVEPEVFVDPTPSRSRRQRAAMPTWDEIVFGTRPDDA